MTIKLNKEISINLPKLIESRLLIQANSGGGKSWAIRRIVEQAFGKVQIIILDPEGEFTNLREKYDFVIAGKEGDAPAEPRSASLLARRLLEHKASTIIDLYELQPQERKRFVRLFCEAMVNAPKELWHDCLVIIDEAHVFAPEKGESEAMGPVIDLATRGRKRGYCAILATQRLSKLHKDAAAECNNKLIGRAAQDIDMKRAADEIGFTSKDDIRSLRDLEPGEFYVFGPAISRQVIKTKIGEVKVKPASRGQAKISTTPPTENVRKILAKLVDLPKEAQKEAQTVVELQTEVRTLKRELSQKLPTREVVATKVERIEIPIVGKRTLEGLKVAESNMRKMLKAVKEGVAVIEGSVNKLTSELAKVQNKPALPTPRVISPKPATEPRQSTTVQNDTDLKGPEQRILNAIAWMESIGVSEPETTAVAFLAGYTAGGGAFNNPKGALRSRGLIEYRGDKLALTDEGRALAQTPDMPLTTDELHQKVIARLPGPEQKILRPLLDAYPNELSLEELAEQSGYSSGGGAFNNPRGRLRSLGLIEYISGGRVKARSILFV